MYQRSQLQLLRKRISEPRKFIQTIIGPRQVGKTTMIKQLVKENEIPSLYVSADDISNPGKIWIEQQWETARLMLKSSESDSFLLIIDEIQKINDWSNTVKALWDSDSFNDVHLKVILLGSSGLLLEKGLTESLAGRFELIRVGHWSYIEMQDAFGFSEEQFVWFGGYPGSVGLMNEEWRWKEYIRNSLIETTISKDILLLTRVDKPALLKRVFELGTAYSSQILSYSKMLGQLQDAGNTTTLTHYLNLLDNAGMICGIEKYYDEEIRKKGSSPKLQVKNTAFISALSNKNFNQIQADREEWGRVFESAIGAHLVNYAQQGNYRVFYWRHVNDEIDFVIEKDNRTIGVEVKSGIAKTTRGIDTFKRKFNPYKVILTGFSGIPASEFLRMNPAELF